MGHVVIIYAKIWTLMAFVTLTAGPALLAGYYIGGGDVVALLDWVSPTTRGWIIVYFGFSTAVAILGALWKLVRAYND